MKDITMRAQLMQNRRVLYQPGWDCHGLPIELKALNTATAKGLSPAEVRAIGKALLQINLFIFPFKINDTILK
jgi:isoleucyl-tRNA synthetase